MSSLNTEIKQEENTIQGQSSDEVENGNNSIQTNILDNNTTNMTNTINEEQKLDTETCIVDKLTNITNAINDIVIKSEEEPCNNNVNNLTEDVQEMNITEKPKAKDGVVVLNEKNTSLNCLLAYGTDEDDDDEDEDSVSEELFNSLSSYDTDGELDDDEQTNESLGAIKKKPLNKPTKTVSEMMYEHLPQVVHPQDLHIPDDKRNYLHIGNVVSILDVLVTIEALPNIPAYDFDTIFFYGDDINDKKPLGQVFDILGQVKSPMYVICMNSIEDIKKMGITKGMKIYSVPESEFTHYVFVNELLKIKGSDASWINDVEVPPDMADYSDDDTEYYNKKTQNRVQMHTKRPHTATPSNSLERYKRFERTMNKCNALNTHVHQLIDKTRKIKAKKQKQQQQQQQNHQVPQFNPVLFDPRVPPPYMTQQYQQYTVNNQQNWCQNHPTTSHTGPYFAQNLQYFGNYMDGNCPGPSSSNN